MSNVAAEKLYLNGIYYVEGSKDASVSYKLEYEVSRHWSNPFCTQSSSTLTVWQCRFDHKSDI